MQAVLVVVALAWFAFVMVATYRLDVLTRLRENLPDEGGGWRVVGWALAVVIWGTAFNVGWLPVILAVSI